MVRRRPSAVAAAVALIVFAMGACVTPVRVGILQRLGWALVTEDPLTRADAIVLTVDVGRAGVLEAAGLVQPRNRHPRRRLFRIAGMRSRRIPPARSSGRGTCGRNHARSAGCWGIGGGEDADAGYGRENQGPVLAQWCAAQRLGAIVVVSLSDHSRRVGGTWRAMQNSPTRVIVRPARYGLFDPNHWWRSRGGIRTQVEELQKLTVDILRHPLS